MSAHFVIKIYAGWYIYIILMTYWMTSESWPIYVCMVYMYTIHEKVTETKCIWFYNNILNI